MPTTHRNVADTEAPTTPPMSCAGLVVAARRTSPPARARRTAGTRSSSGPREKKNPTPSGFLPLCIRIARGVVDGRDVVGVECVTEAERVGEGPRAGVGQAEGVAVVQEESPADHVQEQDEPVHPPEAAPLGGGEREAVPDGHPPPAHALLDRHPVSPLRSEPPRYPQLQRAATPTDCARETVRCDPERASGWMRVRAGADGRRRKRRSSRRGRSWSRSCRSTSTGSGWGASSASRTSRRCPRAASGAVRAGPRCTAFR